MLRFVIWEINFLLSGNDDEIGRFESLHGGFDEGGGGGIYGINNFLGVATWKIRFPNGDTETGMVSLL
jgi:hypothetical protein